MELRLVNSTGLPKDAMLSIKSGTSRSQGLATSSSPFKFPVGAPEQVVKVDVLSTVASGYLIPTLKQDKFKQYQVDLEGGPAGMQCDLELRPAGAGRPGTAGTLNTTMSLNDEISGKAMRSYVEEKQIMPSIREALLRVAKEKPQDPFEFMAKHFRGIRDKALQEKKANAKPEVAMVDAIPMQKSAARAQETTMAIQAEQKAAIQMVDAGPMQKSAAKPGDTTMTVEVEQKPAIQMVDAGPVQKSAAKPEESPLTLEVEKRPEEAQKVDAEPVQKSAPEQQEAAGTAQVEERGLAAAAGGAAEAATPSPVASPSPASPKSKPNLRIQVLKAEGLRDADVFWGGGLSDPYCVCYLHKKGEQKPVEIFRTEVVNDNLHPVWHHKEQAVPSWEEGEKLEFRVYDKDMAPRDDFLGRVDLETTDILPNGFEGRLKLLEAGKKIDAYITVHVKV